MFENLSRNEKILLAIFSLMAIVFAYYSLVLKPIYNKIDVENQTINGYNAEIVTFSNLAIKNKKDQIDLNTLKAKVSTMTLQLPKVEKNPQLVFDIKDSADNYGLSIKDLTFTTPSQYTLAPTTSTTTGTSSTSTSPATTNQGADAEAAKKNLLLFAKMQVVPVKITVTGNYNKIMNFIQEIETGTRLAVIKTVDLTPGVSSTASGTTTTTSMLSPTNGASLSKVSVKQSNIKNIILLNDLLPSNGSTNSTKGTTNSSNTNNTTNGTTNNTNGSSSSSGGSTTTPSTGTTTNADGTNSSTPNSNNTTVPSVVAPTYEVQAAIEINYYYVLSDTNIGEYNFNTGTYGKTDVFK